MPELPEVETMVRGVRPHLLGRRIVAARRYPCRCRPIAIQPNPRAISRRIRDVPIRGVRRLAKRVVIDLASADALVVEPRMTGLMLLADPPSRQHLRFEWSLDGDGDYNRLWFWDRRGLGTLRLYSAGELAAEFGPERLGPDALSISEDDLGKRCSRTRRAIKTALLDQKFVAGVGNLYASEILHAARIHPEHTADRLRPRDIARLVRAIREVLNEAIRYEGSTLNDGTYRNALNRRGGYQAVHRVYARAGETCPTCRRSRIRRIVQTQRSTFFCPRCQWNVNPKIGRERGASAAAKRR